MVAPNSSPSVSANSVHTPESSAAATDAAAASNVSKASIKPAVANEEVVAPTRVPSFPPPKTDKPRPHVCTTCMRSFARLEHLKRHERSHTKEKPFECPSCTRCFARRDLLLRHQQKLHSTTTPSSRPRNGRRESTTGVANGRVRKNSLASTAPASMRPRANTLSHIDTSTMGMLANGQYGRQFAPIHNHHNSFSGIAPNPNFGFRHSMNPTNTTMSGLPRLDTHGLSSDPSHGLRTAPPYAGFGADFDMGGFSSPDNGDTINPHALHMPNSNFVMDGSWDASQQMFLGLPTTQTLTEDDGFDWVTHGFENQMNFAIPNETAIDDSSPSAMSTNSPAQFVDNPQVTQQAYVENANHGMNGYWQANMMNNAAQMLSSPMSMDMNSFFGDMGPSMGNTISPKSLLAQQNTALDNGFPTPPELSSLDPSTVAFMSNGSFSMAAQYENVGSTASTASMDSSLRNGSVTAAAIELVNDHMRNKLITGLNQSTSFGQRKQSQPVVSSPLSPAGSSKTKLYTPANFPSTYDLQRYVASYIKYYHPHLPFLHIATLNFDSGDFNSFKASGGNIGASPTSPPAGGLCLMLAIAALGALFENDLAHSRELFESAKRLISSYLEERRKIQNHKSQFPPHQRTDRDDTPLWLVQAMMLNVIYGHNCGDKQAADIASNHCAALVSLARGAELAKPYSMYNPVNAFQDSRNLQPGHGMGVPADVWQTPGIEGNDQDWYEWKAMEERKRTLYAIFILSSMLVTAYNRAPALTNSEIRLDLPCEEELWSANSAQTWRSLGGSAAVEKGSIQFASALTHLLTAAQRKRRAGARDNTGEAWAAEENSLRPSSFGCLVLINALHNYIWETRQRHLGRQWTAQEIDSMHAHIEPALRAWQAAWQSNPMHVAERPNPFGAGPLSADSVPLLDLAYVRLFVDFGRSKEAYWQRDYDSVSQALANGSEIPSTLMGLESPTSNLDAGSQVQIHDNIQEPITTEMADGRPTRPTLRERHLRKAAFFAADHLMASDRLGFSFNEDNARDLPIASVLCTCDSAQVLAEWATTVQERVGRNVGILGRDNLNLTQSPFSLLLDDEDRKLFGILDQLLAETQAKHDFAGALAKAQQGGYGSLLLVLTSKAMERAAIWPVTKLMAKCLATQAGHVTTRVFNS